MGILDKNDSFPLTLQRARYVKDGPTAPRTGFLLDSQAQKESFLINVPYMYMYGLFSFSFPTGARALCPRRPTYLGSWTDGGLTRGKYSREFLNRLARFFQKGAVFMKCAVYSSRRQTKGRRKTLNAPVWAMER